MKKLNRYKNYFISNDSNKEDRIDSILTIVNKIGFLKVKQLEWLVQTCRRFNQILIKRLSLLQEIGEIKSTNLLEIANYFQ